MMARPVGFEPTTYDLAYYYDFHRYNKLEVDILSIFIVV